MTAREKMIAGSVYDPSDDELIRLRQNAHRLSKEYNDCFETDEKREKILAELIPNKGKNVYLQGPVQFDYGCFTEIGENSYANFNLPVWTVHLLRSAAMYLWDRMFLC